MLRIVITFTFISVCSVLWGQQKFEDFERDDHTARFVFYNLENLFDTFKDSIKRDEDFTPKGQKFWTPRKYWEKQKNISKVILSVGGWDLPEVVAFCEVENRRVLEDLINQTGLKDKGYKILHYESPDRRGIDVGLIYLPEKVEVLNSNNIPIIFPWDENYKTRDILYAQFLMFGSDTINFFVNHWPSKWGGHMETDKSRLLVGQTLKSEVNKLLFKNKNAQVLLMGDFNDEPTDNSLVFGLEAKTDSSKLKSGDLYNVTSHYESGKYGTHKFQNNWSVIDQVIITSNVLWGTNGLQIKNRNCFIYKPDYLITMDEKFNGEKPFRSYAGMKYTGGYSDHLPVYLDIIKP